LTGILPAEEKKTSKIKIGYSERFRFVGWDNSISLDEDRPDANTFTRHRTSLSLTWRPNADIELGVKLTNEFRVYLAPKHRDFEIHEIVFDQLYLKWKNIGKLPLTLTLGRQNIILGEGFLVIEGYPLDGSRTIYFNAVRADYQFDKAHKLTAFFTYQPETDNILPVINDQDVPLVEQPMRGFGLYYTGMFKKSRLEAYFIRKCKLGTDTRPIESKIHALGARLSVPLANRLSLTAEAARQFGTRGDHRRAALGGYFHLDYKLAEAVPLLKMFTLGGIYLSGDDPATDKVEGWDPLFSRWPKWSESYIYTLIKENGVGYWSNLSSLYVALTMDLTKNVDLKMTYHRLGAMEEAASGFPGGTGKTRGGLLIARMNMKVNKHTTAHFVWENFKPGDFYFTGADAANWLRFEVMFRF
jgi:hypothetical protein